MAQSAGRSEGVKLSPILDLTAAGPLQAELQALRGQAIRLDASAVERIGALCLQVLLSARKTWQAEGLGFVVEAPSANFEQGLGTLGASFLLTSSPRE